MQILVKTSKRPRFQIFFQRSPNLICSEIGHESGAIYGNDKCRLSYDDVDEYYDDDEYDDVYQEYCCCNNDDDDAVESAGITRNLQNTAIRLKQLG